MCGTTPERAMIEYSEDEHWKGNEDRLKSGRTRVLMNVGHKKKDWITIGPSLDLLLKNS